MLWGEWFNQILFLECWCPALEIMLKTAVLEVIPEEVKNHKILVQE
jgi:hypothetical protein